MTNLLALLALAVAPAVAGDQPALTQLLKESGYEVVPFTAAPVAAPARMAAPGHSRPSASVLERETVACVMGFEYRERAARVVVVRVWKELVGTATITCEGMAPVRFLLRAEGPSIGFDRLPEGVSRSADGRIGGQALIRLPLVFVPENLEGSYHDAGGEVAGAGGTFTPWTRGDGTAAHTLYLPADMDAVADMDMRSLTLRLAR
ncbi:MAG: hypothetical protein SF051_09325 [Elusimicrobiota bacterium]|nr:hypothetical protein [Elusimicrobiota bacterium]